jgi:hypothetical protein
VPALQRPEERRVPQADRHNDLVRDCDHGAGAAAYPARQNHSVAGHWHWRSTPTLTSRLLHSPKRWLWVAWAMLRNGMNHERERIAIWTPCVATDRGGHPGVAWRRLGLGVLDTFSSTERSRGPLSILRPSPSRKPPRTSDALCSRCSGPCANCEVRKARGLMPASDRCVNGPNGPTRRVDFPRRRGDISS